MTMLSHGKKHIEHDVSIEVVYREHTAPITIWLQCCNTKFTLWQQYDLCVVYSEVETSSQCPSESQCEAQ